MTRICSRLPRRGPTSRTNNGRRSWYGTSWNSTSPLDILHPSSLSLCWFPQASSFFFFWGSPTFFYKLGAPTYDLSRGVQRLTVDYSSQNLGGRRHFGGCRVRWSGPQVSEGPARLRIKRLRWSRTIRIGAGPVVSPLFHSVNKIFGNVSEGLKWGTKGTIFINPRGMTMVTHRS